MSAAAAAGCCCLLLFLLLLLLPLLFTLLPLLLSLTVADDSTAAAAALCSPITTARAHGIDVQTTDTEDLITIDARRCKFAKFREPPYINRLESLLRRWERDNPSCGYRQVHVLGLWDNSWKPLARVPFRLARTHYVACWCRS